LLTLEFHVYNKCSSYVPLCNVSVCFVVTSAQDLLDQWAAEKLNFSDAYMDSDHLEMPLQTSKTSADIKRQWDQLTDIDCDNGFTSASDITHKGDASQHLKPQKNHGEKLGGCF